ncbi:MAG: alanine racemase [Deltaproteobacteria bacterium]|nr:alanine racemase [Deltaproteobacteria bacterium]
MEHPSQARPTVAEIDGRALADNFTELARIAGGRAAVLPVVKSDAYGHGLTLVARILHGAGAERFAVATAAEGEALRAAGLNGGVLVLGGVYPAEYDRVVAARLTPIVWDIETPRALAARARAAGRVVPVHVKVDTGMSRLGVAPADAPALLRALAELDGVTVEGLLTHFADAESVDHAGTVRQLTDFERLVAVLEDARLRPPLVHAANSAATLTAPRARFDAVRPGLALYGIHPSPASREAACLRPAMRLVTRIVACRALAPGVAVSYGGTFVARRASTIATLPVGYADGYPRALSNRGEVVVRGVRAQVAGRVCMDQTMIDVTDVAGVAVGDEVVLWGGPLPVEEVAARAETIPYELLVRVGARVPRVLASGEEETWHGSRERS